MIQKKDLVQIYIEGYRAESRKKRNTVRQKDYEDRLERLRRILQRAKSHRVSTDILEDYHRQLRNLSHHAYRLKNNLRIRQLEEEIIPNLVRLDMEFVLPKDRESMGESFLEYLENDVPGEVCVKSLFTLLLEYRQYSVKNKILDMVPDFVNKFTSGKKENSPVADAIQDAVDVIEKDET